MASKTDCCISSLTRRIAEFRFQVVVTRRADRHCSEGYGRRAKLAPSGHSVQAQLRSAWSPPYRFSALRLMPAITAKAITFNNHLGFEQGFWRKLKRFATGGVRLLRGLLASHENRIAHFVRRYLRATTKHSCYHLAQIRLARTKCLRPDRLAQGAMAQLQRQGLRLRLAG